MPRSAVLAICASLAACGGEAQSNGTLGDHASPGGDTIPATSPADTARPADADIVVIPLAVAEPLTTLLLADTLDLDDDGTDEVVELWVAAQRDDRGRLMMDDGQRWLLAVRDEDRLQPLFEEFVQLAAPRVWIYDPEAGGPPVIALELAAQAGFRVETYRYDPARTGYLRETRLALTGNLLTAGPMDPALH